VKKLYATIGTVTVQLTAATLRNRRLCALLHADTTVHHVM